MTKGTNWAFILVAAGSGSRMGGIPKQFRLLGTYPLWYWSARVAERLYEAGKIDELILVFPQGFEPRPDMPTPHCPHAFVQGGETRSQSVINGLRSTKSRYVMIHDAARPFLAPLICEALIEATSDDAGALPLAPSVDSLKEIGPAGIRALPREKIHRTQTPQAFPREALLDVLATFPDGATDEGTLWLEAGKRLESVTGSDLNFKITTSFDWMMANSVLNATRVTRTGIGYDVHELAPGRKLILGGVEVASPLGLLGHSDADVISHAVADALLGAVGEPDIGTLFPASDEKYRGVDSTLLLNDVLRRLRENGWDVVWIDVVLVAQVPRLSAKSSDISENLNALMRVYNLCDRLNLKVKSGEHVGGAGRAECMVCHAAATVERFVFV